MSSRKQEPFIASLGRYEAQVEKRLRSLDQEGFSEKLWAGDAALWKADPEVQKKIKNRLGWLTVTKTMAGQVGELGEFAQSVKEAGFTEVVLLGMGGSSLCPEVCRMTFGVADGYPDLKVLDSTDPATILHVEKDLDLRKTLFIVASKSGTTIEVQSLYRYFSEKVRAIERNSIGKYFIAITDLGTPLENLAKSEGFKKVFLNPSDIGGRYSALSYFGLVPAALIGINLDVFLNRAERMVQLCGSGIPAEENPGIRLGVILGELGKAGRDKVTLITSPSIRSFGVWAEQLLAESTGKDGKGLVPIEGEAIGSPEVYGEDRLFIHLSTASSTDQKLNKTIQALERSGHPAVKILLRDSLDLAGEFFRWEIATAVAGAILGINPFDEPNVTESKENTRKVLEEAHKIGKLYPQHEISEEKGEAVTRFLNQSKAADYVVLMAYLERSDDHERLLQEIRLAIRDHFRVATMLGYGPRFLHSTGQLHKGGPPNGLFLQITADDKEDIPIPGEKYTFGILKRAQALGDFYSLTNRGLRVLQIHLGQNIEKDLKRLLQSIK